MRILKWHNDLYLGGTQATLERQAIELGRRGHEVVVSCFIDGAMDRTPNLTNKCNVALKPINRANKENEFQQLVNTFKPHIIHSFRSGYPEFAEPGRDFALNGAKFVETNVFGNYDHNSQISKTLYMSEYLWKNVAKTTGPRFDFVNNATSLPAVEPFMVNPLRKMCGPNTIVLGRIGRDNDGIYDPIAVEAVDILCKKRPELNRNILFYVMSPPPSFEADLRKYKINYLVADSTANPETISQFLHMCDIFCHFRADGESGGLAIQEAMMHGKPVITHVSSPKDPNMFPFQNQCRVVEDEKTGYVVNYDSSAYADALEALIDDEGLRWAMGNAGREKAMTEFSTEVCVDKVERIYKELIDD